LADRHRICAECGTQFTYQVARGTDKKFCSSECQRLNAARKYAEKIRPQCQVEGCSRPARSVAALHCETHYYRLRRNGHLNAKLQADPPPKITTHSQGYVLEHMTDHPLWGETKGRIYQHRRVYFDAHGKGPHQCHWCGSTVVWGSMHVDHVNAVRDDNRLSNLVASCPKCNVSRAAPKSKAAARDRSTARLTMGGECLSISEWAERIGITAQSLRSRISAGWSVEKALTTPRGSTGPK
jgi:uncharacterized Zn-finger protein